MTPNTSNQNKLSPALQYIAEYDGSLATIPTSKMMTLSVTVMPTQANASNGINEQTKEPTSWFQILSNFKASYGGTNADGVMVDGNATVNILKIKIQHAHMAKYSVTTDELTEFFNKHYVDTRFVTLPISIFSPVFESKACGKKRNQAGELVTDFVKTPIKNQFEAVVSEYFDLRNFMLELDNTFTGEEISRHGSTPSLNIPDKVFAPSSIDTMTKSDMVDFIGENKLSIDITLTENKLRKAIVDLLK